MSTEQMKKLKDFIAEAESEKVKCKCGTMFTPSHGEYKRCPDCLADQHAAAEKTNAKVDEGAYGDNNGERIDEINHACTTIKGAILELRAGRSLRKELLEKLVNFQILLDNVDLNK